MKIEVFRPKFTAKNSRSTYASKQLWSTKNSSEMQQSPSINVYTISLLTVYYVDLYAGRQVHLKLYSFTSK